jgi:hypothetical protein
MGQVARPPSWVPLVLKPAKVPILVRGQRAAAHGAEGWLTLEILAFAPPPDSDVAVKRHPRMPVVDEVIVPVPLTTSAVLG